MKVRRYSERDLPEMIRIWNGIVDEGNSFPQEEHLDAAGGREFFASQSFAGVAGDDKRIAGLYILHPNNVGRCGHICNASYGISPEMRGRHIGEMLVSDSIRKARELGFAVMQFNAVVTSNVHARHLYERLGFKTLGTVPKGFRMKDGHYEDICLYYYEL